MINWPTDVVEGVARRRVVVVLGSGVSANAETPSGERPPTWGTFLKLAYEKLGRSVPYIASALRQYNYLTACDYLRTAHGVEWNRIVAESFSTPPYQGARIHKAIFDLDCRIVASLNFDRIYETYASSASQGTVIVKNYNDGDMRQIVAGPGRYVVKPHGSIDSISSMIFTLSDYATARTSHRSFYELFGALLHTHIFLFVGCGLSDPDLQLMFEDYRHNHKECSHYITLPTPVYPEQIDLIRRTRGINVLKYSPKQNHQELTDSLVELGKVAGSFRNTLSNDQNW